MSERQASARSRPQPGRASRRGSLARHTPVKAAVVGAGVGGLVCALRLAEAGWQVTVFEANATPGGKAGRLELGGFSFDTGPSLVTTSSCRCGARCSAT